jgi:hypothetical protein
MNIHLNNGGQEWKPGPVRRRVLVGESSVKGEGERG